jgi:flavin reductase (DIM6/NTAB) family NADH-FMN oxidoreductase RutF
MMAFVISSEAYRSAMRHYPAGVTVVTLAGTDGPVGFTATSFASLSLQPPLISFNIAHTSSSLAAARAAATLVVHFLGEHQRQLAVRFARAAEHRFADPGHWSICDTGEPVLTDSPVRLHCRVHRLIELGDHTLVVAQVNSIVDQADISAGPLLYHDGEYAGLRQCREDLEQPVDVGRAGTQAD